MPLIGKSTDAYNEVIITLKNSNMGKFHGSLKLLLSCFAMQGLAGIELGISTTASNLSGRMGNATKKKIMVAPPSLNVGYIHQLRHDFNVVPLVDISVFQHEIMRFDDQDFGEVLWRGSSLLSLGLRFEKKLSSGLSAYSQVAIRRSSTHLTLGPVEYHSPDVDIGLSLRGWSIGVGGRLSWSKHVASLHGVHYEQDKEIGTTDSDESFRAKLKGWSLQNALVYTLK